MFEWLGRLINGEYAPHGYCLLWDPTLVWTHIISDALIALAYFSIPVALVTFVRKRRDVFGKMFWLFALFILSCGMTHVMGIWNLYHGDYGVEAAIKALTAIASVPTAILLWPLLPKALAIPSPSQLQLKNEELAAAVAERDAALERLRAEVRYREQAEAALVQAKKIEAMGQLTGGIAHDFNNLLQAIGGNLELIARSPDKVDKVQRWAGNAWTAVDRGTKLTGQLLTFSRRQRLEAKSIDVSRMLDGMAELIRNSVGPQVEVEIQAADNLCPVAADPTQLELAILNLAINARDAMPEGGKLSISAGQRDGRLFIAVKDTGTGMSAEVKERALEPFFTTKGPGQGTGLGLSMAYGVAHQAEGELTIDSEEGRGTTVTICLPCTDMITPSELPAATEVAASPPAAQGRILLVDDDVDVRSTLSDLLEAQGHTVLQADSGTQALQALADGGADLMLLDFAMPGLNGAEVAEQALQRWPDLKLVFITGFSDSEAIDRAVAGRALVLRKPVAFTELATTINKMLG